MCPKQTLERYNCRGRQTVVKLHSKRGVSPQPIGSDGLVLMIPLGGGRFGTRIARLVKVNVELRAECAPMAGFHLSSAPLCYGKDDRLARSQVPGGRLRQSTAEYSVLVKIGHLWDAWPRHTCEHVNINYIGG
jgi:hypothetical protein